MSADKPGDDEKGEPRENDKCMEDGHGGKDVEVKPKKPRFGLFGQRAKALAEDRYHLVIILLCILLFIFFIVIIVLSVQLNSIPRPEPDTRCYSPECLSLSSSLLQSMDATVDPCDDFYSYACNGYFNMHPLEPNRGQFGVQEVMTERIYHEVRHIIDLIDDNADEASPESKVKRFYKTCMDPRGLTMDSVSFFQHNIRRLGGWEMVRSSSWSKMTWSVDETIEKLMVQYGVNPFFRIVVGVDDDYPDQEMIKIVPDGLGLPGVEYYNMRGNYSHIAKAYKELLKSVAEKIGEVTSSEAEMFAETIFHYEERLAKNFPSVTDMKHIYVKYEKTTVDRLTAYITSNIKWLRLFEAYFRNADVNVEKSTAVAVLHKPYFEALASIIASTDDRTSNNYVMWRLAFKYAQHLDKELRQYYNKFIQTLNGAQDVEEPREERWIECIRHTSHYLGHAVGKLYVDHFDKREVEQKKQEASKIINTIISSAVSGAKYVPWLRDEHVETIQEKINNVAVYLGYSASYEKQAFLEDYYKGLIVKIGSHIDNVFQAEAFQTTTKASIYKGINQLDKIWTVYPQDVTAVYNYAENSLVIPYALLNGPIYELNKHSAMLFGSFGGIVGTHILKAFDEAGIHFVRRSDLRYDYWLSQESLASYNATLECLTNNTPPFDSSGLEINPELTVSKAFADIAGIHVAFKAFQGYRNNFGPLPGVPTSVQQLFFIGYAQSMCQSVTVQNIKNFNDSSFSAPNRISVLQTLQQTRAFSEAFECPYESRMIPSERCGVW